MVSVKYTILAVSRTDRATQIVVNDPLDFYAIEDVKSFVQGNVDILLCKKEDLTRMIAKTYAEIDARKAASIAQDNAINNSAEQGIEIDGDTGEKSPVVNLVNRLIMKAYSEGVSDIHIEPFTKTLKVRFRVDGQLLNYMDLDPNLSLQVATRIKIVSQLDIAERRIPQDGNFRVRINGNEVGIRVSVIPTVFGEKIVLRFLSQAVKFDFIDSYGMNEDNYKVMKRLLNNPYGVIYITGPTGSGKTSTLYMMIESMSKNPINISTIEDPVERNLPGVIQIQVNPKAGLTFSGGLRSLLRQDPDIVLVGETRDSETAQIAVSAAITGHLVLSTLHTNDAISSIIRLEDMGIKPYLLANALAGVVAQRLVKKICPLCKESYRATEEEQLALPQIRTLYRGAGCANCGNTGYKGRIAVHEILEIDKEIRAIIVGSESTEEVYRYVKEHNKMKFIKENIISLVDGGITTFEEYQKHIAFDI